MRYILVFSMLMCLMMACQSAKHFTSRKYMSGHYVSGPARAHRVKALDAQEGRIATTTRFYAKADLQPLSGQDVGQVASTHNRQDEIPTKKNPDIKPLSISGKNKVRTGSQLFVQKPIKAAHLKKTKSQKVDPEAQKNRISFKSLASVLLSGFGLVLNIAITLAVAAFSFSTIYLVPLVLGIILGISGGLLGLSSIRDYRTDREKIYKRKKSMIFGIVGASMGLAAIVVVAYFCAFALLSPLMGP